MSGSRNYGARWYLYRDGVPPPDDDDSYRWNGTQWVRFGEDDGDVDEDALEDWEERRRQRIARSNEY